MRISIEIAFLIALIMLNACVSGRRLTTQRGIDGLIKPGTPHLAAKPAAKINEPLFTERRVVNIDPVDNRSQTGSLYDLNDNRNVLALDYLPPSLGEYLEFKIANSTLAEPVKPQASEEAKAATPSEATSSDADIKEMLAQLPQLDPGDQRPPLIKSVRMRIEHIYPNGDVLVAYYRSSQTDGDDRTVDITARVAASAIQRRDKLTSNDLTRVRWRDTLDGQLADRSAEAWQDEYSLRLSGYSEARSLQARQLEDKRKQLADVRQRLSSQLNSLGKERQKFSQERAAMGKERTANAEKVEKLSAELSAANEKVAELEDDKKSLEEEINGSTDSSTPPAINGGGAAPPTKPAKKAGASKNAKK